MDEEQYILRLPEPLVERMRFALSSTKRRDAAGEDRKPSTFAVNFHDPRNATFTVDGAAYPASLMDLPCLVETHKTADKRTFYKSGDLHQVLVVRMPDEPSPHTFTLQDGLTPPAKDAATRLAPPNRLFSHSQVESVEHRVKYVIDNKINLVAKKDRPPLPDEEDVVIEEETTDNVTASAPKPVNAAKPPTGRAPSAPKDAPPSAAAHALPDPPVHTPDVYPTPIPLTPAPLTPAAMTPSALTPGPMPGAGTPAPMTPMTMTPGPMTPGAMTPAPDTPFMEGEGDGPSGTYYGVDDDDFDEITGALLGNDEEDMAKKQIERATVDKKIEEQKAKIKQLEEKAGKAPNPVLRQRILGKRPDLQKALKALQQERAALGEEDHE